MPVIVSRLKEKFLSTILKTLSVFVNHALTESIDLLGLRAFYFCRVSDVEKVALQQHFTEQHYEGSYACFFLSHVSLKTT